ncbi:MAG: ferrous iron transport protein A [Clostridia bacterium]|nr:ferrous iron transport protein A [Clostridia bacterium]
MTLFDLAGGDRCRICALPRDKVRRAYYTRLGFCQNEQVELLYRRCSGGVVKIRGIRLALSREAMREVGISGKKAVSCGQPQLG